MKPRRKPFSFSEVSTATIFLLPTLAGILLFALIPLGLSFKDSFFNFGFYEERSFVGTDNYLRVLQDRNFWNAIWVGLKFTLL